MTETEEHFSVLICGGGLVGLAGAVFLARQGVHPLLVDRHPGVSIHGRARGINQRTMEIYRAYGIDQQVHAAGKPFDAEAGVASCETLASEWHWLYDAEEPRVWPELTAGAFCMADQNTVEPILVDTARRDGATHRFNTELTSFEATENGVIATTTDRTTGQMRTIRADYLIAADGNRSPIRQKLGIDRAGETTFMHSMNIVFRADLSAFLPRRALFWIITGVGGGLVSTADPHRWQLTVSYDPTTEGVKDFTDSRCVSLVRGAIGKPDLDVTVEDVAAWEQGVGVAERYRDGHVFLAGDSAHTWPPAGALGANTGVQDIHNLAWKIAAVTKGWSDPALLDTYEKERLPIAHELAPMIVRHQQARMSGETAEEMDPQRQILGQLYGHEKVFTHDLNALATEGARAPHLWLTVDGKRTAAHDLFVDEHVLLCDSPAWEQAAAKQPFPIKAVRAEHADGWSARYGGGATLVRPDGYVARRYAALPADPAQALRRAAYSRG
jgi:2-polyprenyl-6-methoxyphenol hydroxylase-like FAD-dependent oxidoreductase